MDGFGVGIPRKHRDFLGGYRLKMNQILRLMWFYFVGRLIRLKMILSQKKLEEAGELYLLFILFVQTYY